jgi:hypothetical protein
MAIVAQSKGEAREPVAAGNYFGVCVGVYDLGTQTGGKFGPKHQVVLQFELHKKKGVCRDKAGNVLLISKFYGLSFHEKSDLRKDVQKILGRSFTDAEAKQGYDVTQLIDVGCRLVVAHEPKEDGSIRDKIDGFMPLDEDDPHQETISNSVVYEPDPAHEIPDAVPEWIRKKVMTSEEWVNSSSKPASPPNGKARPPANDDDDDIKF